MQKGEIARNTKDHQCGTSQVFPQDEALLKKLVDSSDAWSAMLVLLSTACVAQYNVASASHTGSLDGCQLFHTQKRKGHVPCIR